MRRPLEAVAGCDCLLEVGCSREVWPAAMLPEQAREAGASVIVVDPEPAGGDVVLRGSAASPVPHLVETAFGPRTS